jgi:hypothetical protein
LQKLEQQLQALLQQVRSLQALSGGGGIPEGDLYGTGDPNMMMRGMGGSGMPGMGSMGMPGMGSMGGGMMGADIPSQGIEVVEAVEVRVYRTTYRLPVDKALGVQSFVAQHFVSEVETRVENDMLVVLTHSAQDEETMRRFIYLMMGAEVPMPAPVSINPEEDWDLGPSLGAPPVPSP